MSREIILVTPEHVELKFEVAGVGSRFVAMLLDTLWQVLATTLLVVVVVVIPGAAALFDDLSSWVIAALVLLLFSLWTGYFLFFETRWNGQTPGKRSAGIRVIRDTGHPLDFRSALLRNVLRAVDSLPGMYAIGFVSVFFSPQYRRLGDYVAGTLVVKTQRKPERRPAKATPAVPESAPESPLMSGVPAQAAAPAELRQCLLPPEATPHLQSIKAEEYRAIRHFLQRRPDLEPQVARSLARRLADPLAIRLQIDPASIGDPVAFLEAVGTEWAQRRIR